MVGSGSHADQDHESHADHDHESHADHNHESHAGHHHESHADHDHESHAGHDRESHAGHDRESHAGHDCESHAGHDHESHAGHDHAHDLRGASRRRLAFALVLISIYMVAEIIGGIMSGNLDLLAGRRAHAHRRGCYRHGLGGHVDRQEKSLRRAHVGYHRTEILAALVNTFALWLIAGWILFEA